MQASDSEDDSMTVINLADWSDEEDHHRRASSNEPVISLPDVSF